MKPRIKVLLSREDNCPEVEIGYTDESPCGVKITQGMDVVWMTRAQAVSLSAAIDILLEKMP